MHGVTAGYLAASLTVAAILFGLGWLLLPLLAVPLAWHALRAALVRTQPARGHEAFLLRTYLLMALLLALLYVAPGIWALRTLDPYSELGALLGTRDPEAILHWLRLWLAEQLGNPGAGIAPVVAAGIAWFVLHAAISVVIGIWLMVRVLRRFLRWSERLPA